MIYLETCFKKNHVDERLLRLQLCRVEAMVDDWMQEVIGKMEKCEEDYQGIMKVCSERESDWWDGGEEITFDAVNGGDLPAHLVREARMEEVCFMKRRVFGRGRRWRNVGV